MIWQWYIIMCTEYTMFQNVTELKIKTKMNQKLLTTLSKETKQNLEGINASDIIFISFRRRESQTWGQPLSWEL